MKSAPTDRPPGWVWKRECWFVLATLLLPLGWVLPLCRFAWARVASRRAARERGSES